MSSSVPGPDVVEQKDKWVAVLGQDHVDRYAKLLEKQSQPYTLYGDSEIVHVPLPAQRLQRVGGFAVDRPGHGEIRCRHRSPRVPEEGDAGEGVDELRLE
jgi:hypothetical protein